MSNNRGEGGDQKEDVLQHQHILRVHCSAQHKFRTLVNVIYIGSCSAFPQAAN